MGHLVCIVASFKAVVIRDSISAIFKRAVITTYGYHIVMKKDFIECLQSEKYHHQQSSSHRRTLQDLVLLRRRNKGPLNTSLELESDG